MTLQAPANATSGPPGPKNPPLGTTRQYCVPGSETALKRRYKLQSLAARLLPDRRVAECHRKIAPGRAGATVMHSESTGRAYFKSLVQCNRLWECPVCAARITQGRRDELSQALTVARQLGYTPVVLTVTLRHHQGDDLRQLVQGLIESWRRFKSGRGWAELREEYAWMGDIRNLEITYGSNGFHPHCHILLFLNYKMTGSLIDGFRKWVAERWLHCLELEGLTANVEHGVNVSVADNDIAEYLAKFGREPKDHWGAADELGRSAVKKGRNDGLSPFELLQAYGLAQDDEFFTGKGLYVGTPQRAGALFVAYVLAFEGRNQLVWSRGLRALLAMEDEPTPDELIDEAAPDAKELLTLPSPAWGQICKHEKRADLLEVASAGDAAAVWEWLRQFGIIHVDLTQYSVGPPAAAASVAPAANQSVVPAKLTAAQKPLF